MTSVKLNLSGLDTGTLDLKKFAQYKTEWLTEFCQALNNTCQTATDLLNMRKAAVQTFKAIGDPNAVAKWWKDLPEKPLQGEWIFHKEDLLKFTVTPVDISNPTPQTEAIKTLYEVGGFNDMPYEMERPITFWWRDEIMKELALHLINKVKANTPYQIQGIFIGKWLEIKRVPDFNLSLDPVADAFAFAMTVAAEYAHRNVPDHLDKWQEAGDKLATMFWSDAKN